VLVFGLVVAEVQKDDDHESVTSGKNELRDGASVQQINRQPTKKRFDDSNRHGLF